MKSKRVLCVEDHVDTAQMIEVFLGQEGYQVVLADTVAEGLRQARAAAFDLHLVDERLPDGSGIDLIRWIRDFDPETPIVFHSASAQPAFISQALGAGAQAFLVKPSDPQELAAAIALLTGGLTTTTSPALER